MSGRSQKASIILTIVALGICGIWILPLHRWLKRELPDAVALAITVVALFASVIIVSLLIFYVKRAWVRGLSSELNDGAKLNPQDSDEHTG